MTNDIKVIASLTSYPPRIKTVSKTIETILGQSYRPYKTFLWLSEEEFPKKERDLPKDLLLLVDKGLQISWCENIRPYKKLLPTLKLYPDYPIITFDDDMFYEKNIIYGLIKSYKKDNTSIHCNRITKIIKYKEKLYAVKRPLYEKNGKYKFLLMQKSPYNKPTGVGGVLYPPKCFNDEIFDMETAKKLCPTSDDLWFYFHGIMNGHLIKICKYNNAKLKYIPDTQKVALCRINDANNNEIFNGHLNNLFRYYKDRINPILRKYSVWDWMCNKLCIDNFSFDSIDNIIIK